MLTNRQKVAVAKDVLKLMNFKTFIIQTGSVFSTDHKYPRTRKLTQSFCKKPDCQVCAKGALFVASVAKFNNFVLANGSTEIRCGEDWGREQADLIEVAFEKMNFAWTNRELSMDTIQRAIKFGRKFVNPRTRLIAICKNIIKNKGVFKP